MGALPFSNGKQHILLIGDHFSKCYTANLLPNQTASKTATFLHENWICPFGCPNSIHSDQGRNLNQNFSKAWMMPCKLTRPEQQPSGPGQTRLCNGWTVRCKRCSPNASTMNKATGHKSYRLSWWHILPRFMNRQGTHHLSLSMDRKSAFLPISRTQTRVINPQPTSMNTCLPDKRIFKKRTIRLAQPWISISDTEMPFTTQMSIDPPKNSSKRSYYPTLSSELVSHQSCLAHGKARMSFYNTLKMWPTAFKKLKLKKNSLVIITDSSGSMNSHRPQKYQRVRKKALKNLPPPKAQQQEPSTPVYEQDHCTWHYA